LTNPANTRRPLIGIQDQTTRDVEDIIAAHETRSEGWGRNNWKQIKFTLDDELPYHQDLGDVGKGFDADANDYEAFQDEADRCTKD
jgi:hypothetical protein